MEKDKNNVKGRSSIAFLKEKKCAQKVYSGWIWPSGGKGLRCVFPFSLSATMLWGWLKLVRPQLVERSEKRTKRKTNWGRPVSPSDFTRVRFSLETRASQIPIVCEAKEKTKAEKDEKAVLFASLSSLPSLQTFSVTACAFLTYAKIRAILQSNWRVWHALTSCT